MLAQELQKFVICIYLCNINTPTFYFFKMSRLLIVYLVIINYQNVLKVLEFLNHYLNTSKFVFFLHIQIQNKHMSP